MKFPFSAILGLDLAKTGLLLHAVDPRMGGVLLSGHRGCAKTTLARAFGQLVGDLVEVPLGASEDRLLGSVDVESVLERNEWKHQVGLLELANGKALYVDEINLLSDALSDLMLDAAATGTYQLEREGFSREIESRFIMIGSMNPDEGELRPQLSDRFAHSVDVRNQLSETERAEVIRRRIAFETDPDRFTKRFENDESTLREQIEAARKRLPQVEFTDTTLQTINQRAAELSLEGMRTELAVARTARAAAAWENRTEISDADLDLAWKLCLGHKTPDLPPPSDSPKPKDPKKSEKRPFSSLQPTDANPEPIELSRKTANSQAFLDWWSKPTTSAENQPKTQIANRGTHINWRATILHWALRGQRRDGFQFHAKTTRTANWFFLDGSRSAGSSGLLATAKGLIGQALTAGTTPKTRQNALLLQNGIPNWLCRNVNRSRAHQEIQEISSATGSSPLVSALKKFTRPILRTGATRNRIVIVSDGINTLTESRTAERSSATMRHQLLHLLRAGADVVWLSPEGKRGVIFPAAAITEGTNATLISVATR